MAISVICDNIGQVSVIAGLMAGANFVEMQYGRDCSSPLHSGSLALSSVYAPLTDSPCSFPRLILHDDAPGLSLRSCAGGCPGPLLAPCSASCSSLLMQRVQTLDDSLARRTGARTRCFAARYLRALSRCSFGPLGHRSPPPVLCSLAGMGKHPPAHNPPGRTPPAPEGTDSRVREPCLRQQGAGPGGRTKRRLPDASAGGRSLCRAGPSLAIAGRQDTGDLLHARAGHGYTARLLGVRDDLSRCVPGRAKREQFCAKALFRKSDNAAPLLSPCARRWLISTHVD
jgi:hypothetical protein